MALTLSVCLAGCASYRPLPLPSVPNLRSSPSTLELDMAQVAAEAVTHSPDLVAMRRQADVSQAQARAAGLLPDPQISASLDHPTGNGPDLVNGYVLELSHDLQALLAQPSNANRAAARKREAQLNLLWAEWQTLQQAASLYTRKVFADRKAARLESAADVLVAQSRRSQQALAGRNTTLDDAGSDLAAALDIASQRDAAVREALAADADLKVLLNLAPDCRLTLADPGDVQPVPRQDVEAALAAVAQRRPDLLALQAGYHAQEEAVRAAIIEQFPAVNVGFNRARDTGDVDSVGLGVSVDIPIFGNTRWKIRTERATRAQLHAEYQARLDQTAADAWRTWRAVDLLRAQVKRLELSLPALRNMAATGRKAYQAGDLPAATYVLFQTTLSAREVDLLDLKAALWANAIALRTVLGLSPLPPDKETHE